MSILTFHSIGESFYPGITNYSRHRFYKLLKKIQKCGYRFASLNDFIRSKRTPRTLALTFDDGFENFYHRALPILRELNIPATVFIPAAYIGKKADWDYTARLWQMKHLTAQQIEECCRDDIGFGSHGLNHVALTQLSEDRLKDELENSKKVLEDITGQMVSFLSYPFGRFNKRVEQSALDSGYKHGLSPGKANSGFTIGCHPVYAYDTFLSVLNKIKSGIPGRLERFKESTVNSFAVGTAVFQKIFSTGAQND
jgi:peptidoglycan/xylan/chitin deacetylase (PgdA/CDA1 family)